MSMRMRFGMLCQSLLAVLFLSLSVAGAWAADLTIDSGVVVKFGPDAGLIVRDRLVGKDGAVLTSVKDAIGGVTATPGSAAAAGDWRGVAVEKSAASAGGLSLGEMTIRYAGSSGSAALSFRHFATDLRYVQISDSIIGLRVRGAVAPRWENLGLYRNGIGVEVDGNATPLISGSFISDNTTFGVVNRTPATLVQATGNWWGSASGPNDAVGNPGGTGSPVSTGVNYGGWTTVVPLLNPSLKLASAVNGYIDRSNIDVLLHCLNATEYRLAETDSFVGVNFKPMTERASYTFSAGDGRKQLYAQYRSPSGNNVTVSLAGGLIVDTGAPTINIVNPANSSIISGTIVVEAQANDSSGIQRIEFSVDGQLQATKTAVPYSFSWNTDTWAEGSHEVKVVAYDIASRTATQSVAITILRAPPPPDTDGPQLTNFKLGGAPLNSGATITASGDLSVDASDRSGISRIDFALDGGVFANGAGSSGNFRARLNLDGIANGAHTLSVRGYDSLNNSTTLDLAITVAHAAPAVPVISQPVNGLTTRDASLTVNGSSEPGKDIRILLNGQQAATATAAADGRFSAGLTLISGINQITATASDAYGTSVPSAAVTITLDTAVPVAPSNLTAAAQAAGKIHLGWLRSSDPNVAKYEIYRALGAFNGIGEAIKIASLSASISAFDDLPPVDGTYGYRVVSVNGAGTPSVPTQLAQAVSDNTPPKVLSIAYQPRGKVDGVSGRVGQGRIDLVVTLSEALTAIPYLSIVPAGGTPITVDLLQQDDTHYTGYFTIDQNTPSGLANAIMSARDGVGNRGTAIASGATINIDTAGPVVTGIVLTPVAPIKADSVRDLTAVLTLSKAAKSTPTVKYQLSGPLRAETPVSGINQLTATTWQVTLQLPTDAGLGQVENLSFTFSAMDDLDNLSTKLSAFNRFQVYQGSLPPAGVPGSFKAEAQPGGKVRLSWTAVDEAVAYQLYRQAPGESELTAYKRVTGIENIDTTTVDGQYRYAIASIRQSNEQESLSGQSTPVQVTASGTAPGAPQNLALILTPQGIYASWQPPVGGTAPASYRLYRSGAASIVTVDGLTPIKTGIKQTAVIDASPSQTEHAYVVTAVDLAGNESAVSNFIYLNFSLLPVKTLTVVQSGSEQPVVSWTPNGNGAVGFDIFVGPDAGKTKLNTALVSANAFADTGYAGGERRYTVDAVDAANVRQSRSITLPSVSAQAVGGLPLKRGIMNKVQVQVVNLSSSPVASVRLAVAVGGRESRSAEFLLGGNETRLVPVIVGGYDDLPNAASMTVAVETVPNEGELTRMARTAPVEVTDSALVIGIAPESFVRGASGKVRLTIENTSEVDVEVLTARNNGNDASDELRFKLLDRDNNVLSTQPYKQALGANVITLTSGLTVARIPAGASYTSDAFVLPVPAGAPDQVTVRLEVDKLRYHSGQPDQVIIRGRGSDKQVSLSETGYYGEIITTTPVSSFGDRDIIITGRAVDRASGSPLSGVPLKLLLNQEGFERKYDILTDGVGSFSYTFKPTLSDAGVYKLAALHPEMTDRPIQGQFVINRVIVGPNPMRLDLPRNYAYTIDYRAISGAGTTASNLRLVFDAQYQPTSVLPQGINVTLPAPITIGARQNLSMPVLVSGDNSAQPSGSFVLKVFSDETGVQPLTSLTVNYTLSEAKPVFNATPNFIEAGLQQGQSGLESVVIENKGLAAMNDVVVTLTNADGSPAPAWVSLGSAAQLGTLQVGDKRSIDINFAPGSGVTEGVYSLKLTFVGSNLPAASVNVFASVTQSGIGSVFFKTSDIYTATRDKNGNLIPGLAGASITLQNEAVASEVYQLTTDALGEALFQNLPAGRYQYKARASNHQELGGRLQIKPGLTINQPVFLDYNLVTVEWTVKEVTIQDRYEITLKATFETDVPAPVVMLEPSSISLPKMIAGDIYYGELTLSNYGLVRADHVKMNFPPNDTFFKYEFLVQVPDKLEAKQRITIPYRVIAVQSLDQAGGAASGGGCYSYRAQAAAQCDYVCANGQMSSSCGSATYWTAASNSTCPGGGGGVGGGSWGGSGGGGGGGGWGGSGGGGYISMPGMPSCVRCPGCDPSGGGIGN